jgi:hypothetical protein
MVMDLYRKYDPELRPELIITNNLGCLAIAMMAQESGGEAYAVYPDDKPMNWILTGGRVLDDYAATIPEDLINPVEDSFWHSSNLGTYLKSKGVSHVVMMVSRLSVKEGPCAVSSGMRRFKSLLLKFVAESTTVHLSIFLEADKFVNRRGRSSEEVNLQSEDNLGYWEQILSDRRVTITAALSPDLSSPQIGLAKREMRDLQEAGAHITLLDLDGKPCDFGND